MRSEKNHKGARAIIYSALSVLAAYFVLKNAPDIARYIKISRM